MFVEPILKRLENMVQSTVAHVSGSVIALFPFLVAVGFGTAAADSYLAEQFGVQIANLILGGAYLVLALLIYGVARAREHRHAEIAREQLEQMPLVNPIRAALDQVQAPGVLIDIAGKSAPAAAQLLRSQAKNLHLLIGAGIGIYIASRIVDALNRSHGYKAR